LRGIRRLDTNLLTWGIGAKKKPEAHILPRI